MTAAVQTNGLPGRIELPEVKMKRPFEYIVLHGLLPVIQPGEARQQVGLSYRRRGKTGGRTEGKIQASGIKCLQENIFSKENRHNLL